MSFEIHTFNFVIGGFSSGDPAVLVIVSPELRRLFEVADLNPNLLEAPEPQGMVFLLGSVTGVDVDG